LRTWKQKDASLSADVDIVKLFTMCQILLDSLLPEPFIRLSLFANAMLQTVHLQSHLLHNHMHLDFSFRNPA